MLDSSNLQQHKGSALLQEINTNSLFNSLQLRLWSTTNICNWTWPTTGHGISLAPCLLALICFPSSFMSTNDNLWRFNLYDPQLCIKYVTLSRYHVLLPTHRIHESHKYNTTTNISNVYSYVKKWSEFTSKKWNGIVMLIVFATA